MSYKNTSLLKFIRHVLLRDRPIKRPLFGRPLGGLFICFFLLYQSIVLKDQILKQYSYAILKNLNEASLKPAKWTTREVSQT